jgi:hypothetical protein
MNTIKVFSKQKPAFPQTVETYNIDHGVKSNSVWYSEVSTDNYINTQIRVRKTWIPSAPSIEPRNHHPGIQHIPHGR